MVSKNKKYCDATTALMKRHAKYINPFLPSIFYIFPVDIDFDYRGCNENKKNVQNKWSCVEKWRLTLSATTGPDGARVCSAAQTRGFTFIPPPYTRDQRLDTSESSVRFSGSFLQYPRNNIKRSLRQSF